MLTRELTGLDRYPAFKPKSDYIGELGDSALVSVAIGLDKPDFIESWEDSDAAAVELYIAEEDRAKVLAQLEHIREALAIITKKISSNHILKHDRHTSSDIATDFVLLTYNQLLSALNGTNDLAYVHFRSVALSRAAALNLHFVLARN